MAPKTSIEYMQNNRMNRYQWNIRNDLNVWCDLSFVSWAQALTKRKYRHKLVFFFSLFVLLFGSNDDNNQANFASTTTTKKRNTILNVLEKNAHSSAGRASIYIYFECAPF